MQAYFILTIAQQGLGVAATYLQQQAKINLEKAKVSQDPNLTASLSHTAEHETTLANILLAAEVGITQYLSNT